MIMSFLKKIMKRKTSVVADLSYSYSPKEICTKVRDFLEDSEEKDVVIVCIGTNRTSIIDFLGPFVGSVLKEDRDFAVPVYGSMINPIHALNLTERISEIKDNHLDSKIIVVDACLSDEDEIGKIIVINEPLQPGSGTHKKCPEVGDISIKGIVGPANVNLLEYSADINFISNMANTIASGLKEALQYHPNNNLNI